MYYIIDPRHIVEIGGETYSTDFLLLPTWDTEMACPIWNRVYSRVITSNPENLPTISISRQLVEGGETFYYHPCAPFDVMNSRCSSWVSWGDVRIRGKSGILGKEETVSLLRLKIGVHHTASLVSEKTDICYIIDGEFPCNSLMNWEHWLPLIPSSKTSQPPDVKKELNDSFVSESFKEKEKEDQLNETISTQGDLNHTFRAEFENDIPKDIDSLSPNHQLKKSKKTSLSITAKKEMDQRKSDGDFQPVKERKIPKESKTGLQPSLMTKIKTTKLFSTKSKKLSEELSDFSPLHPVNKIKNEMKPNSIKRKGENISTGSNYDETCDVAQQSKQSSDYSQNTTINVATEENNLLSSSMNENDHQDHYVSNSHHKVHSNSDLYDSHQLQKRNSTNYSARQSGFSFENNSNKSIRMLKQPYSDGVYHHKQQPHQKENHHQQHTFESSPNELHPRNRTSKPGGQGFQVRSLQDLQQGSYLSKNGNHVTLNNLNGYGNEPIQQQQLPNRQLLHQLQTQQHDFKNPREEILPAPLNKFDQFVPRPFPLSHNGLDRVVNVSDVSSRLPLQQPYEQSLRMLNPHSPFNELPTTDLQMERASTAFHPTQPMLMQSMGNNYRAPFYGQHQDMAQIRQLQEQTHIQQPHPMQSQQLQSKYFY